MPRFVKHEGANAGAKRWTPTVASTAAPTVETPASQIAPPNAAYVRARINRSVHLCLLDTGADANLIPLRYVDSRQLTAPQQNKLYAANDIEITVDGEITLSKFRNTTSNAPFLPAKMLTKSFLGEAGLLPIMQSGTSIPTA